MEEHIEFPKVDGEKVWLTQAISMNTNGVNRLIKAVFIGAPVAIEAVWARLVERQTLSFENGFSLKIEDLAVDVPAKASSVRRKLRNSPHMLLSVVNPNGIGLIGRKTDMRHVLYGQLQQRGVPYTQAWDEYLVPEMGEWLVPLHSFNVSQDKEVVYFCKVPSQEQCFNLFRLFMKDLEVLARKELLNGCNN